MLTFRLTVPAILRETERLSRMDDSELRELSETLRWRIKGRDTPDRVLRDVYALVRESCRRVLGLLPHPVQVYGAVCLHRGRIIEMSPGEGKTLVATMPAVLHGMTGRGVHVITANEYLARRDAEELGKLYRFLGVSVDCVHEQMTASQKQKAYHCDITYGTAGQFTFDLLRDTMTFGPMEESFRPGAGPVRGTRSRMQRQPYFAIVDEADSILIDGARMPLILSGGHHTDEPSPGAFEKLNELALTLSEDREFRYTERTKSMQLTLAGRHNVRRQANDDALKTMSIHSVYQGVERALLVQHRFRRDRDYIIRNEQVLLVDEYTGRASESRKWRGGVQQAIEAKEKLSCSSGSSQTARTTLQRYFRRYERLAGMTGTAWSSRRELQKLYELKTVRIPTHRTSRRKRLPGAVFSSHNEKLAACVRKIRSCHEAFRPVLVGTRSVEKSEELSAALRAAEIPHKILNARHDESEAAIIADAGLPGAVTIATNMAGRGTDIRLGKGVADLGGLHVIGMERHESRRIDEQLAGRCGRQGQPGTYEYFLAIDDELVTNDIIAGFVSGLMSIIPGILGGGWVRRHLLPWVVRAAQNRVERKHSGQRRLLMELEKQQDKLIRELGLDPSLNIVD